MISQFIERKEKQEEAQKKEAQEFEALSKFLQAAHDVPKEQITPLSLGDLRGLARGMESKRVMKEKEEERAQAMSEFSMRAQESAARREELARRAAQEEEAVAGLAQFAPAALERLKARGMELRDEPPDSPKLAEWTREFDQTGPMLQALAQNPRLGLSPQFREMGATLARFAPQGAAPEPRAWTSPGGRPYVVHGGSILSDDRGDVTPAMQAQLGAREAAVKARRKSSIESLLARLANTDAQSLLKGNKSVAELRETLEAELAELKGGGESKGGTLTREQAKALLDEAGGDADKARALARKRGYTF